MSEVSRSSGFLPIKPSSSPEEAQKHISSAPAQQVAGIEQSKVDEGVREGKKDAFETVSRSLSDGDIMDQLFKIQRPPTRENKQLLSTMIQHGIPANAEAFDDIQALIKGQKQSATIQSAVVAYAKGVGGSVASMDVVASYFANQTDLAMNFKRMKGAGNRLTTMMSSYSHLIDPGLFSGLTSILSEFDASFNKLMRQKSDGSFALLDFKRGKLIYEYKLLHDFLSGFESKLKSGSVRDIAALKSEFAMFKAALKGGLDALTAQSILSRDMMSQGDKDVAYHYWQVPNPMAPTDRSLDILIQKDAHRKDGVNVGQTRIVLRFDTPDLGEVSVIIDLKQNKVSYMFQTDNGDTRQLVSTMSKDLKDRMEELDYEMVGIRSVEKKLDIKKLLIPVLNLDNMTRIIAEA